MACHERRSRARVDHRLGRGLDHRRGQAEAEAAAARPPLRRLHLRRRLARRQADIRTWLEPKWLRLLTIHRSPHRSVDLPLDTFGRLPQGGGGRRVKHICQLPRGNHEAPQDSHKAKALGWMLANMPNARKRGSFQVGPTWFGLHLCLCHCGAAVARRLNFRKGGWEVGRRTRRKY